MKLLLIACFLGLSLFSKVGYSIDYYLNEVAEFTFGKTTNHHWLAPLSNPMNSDQFFISSETGEVFLIATDTVLTAPILDLNKALKSPQEIKLTALAVHPNFKFFDRPGYATIYTAHIENYKNTSNLSRLKPLKNGIIFEYDAVITQWQYDYEQQKFSNASQREIIRIALPDKHISVIQLAFNPNSRAWEDDYGLLYIALTSSQSFASHPLYSGTILRIHPDKYSSKKDSLQKNKLTTKGTDSQSDVVFSMGAQNISQLFWPDNYPNQLLMVHQYNQQQYFTLIDKDGDWYQKLPRAVSRKNEFTSPSMSSVLYQGSEFSHLYGNLLSLHKNSEGWHLKSSSLIQKKHKQSPTKIIWTADPKLISSFSQISIHTTHHGELFLFNHSNNILYALTSTPPLTEQVKNKDKVEVNITYLAKIIARQLSITRVLLVITVIIIWLLVKSRFKPKSSSIKGVLDRQLTSFAFNEIEQSISLYRHHIKKVDIKLSLADIKRSEVYLNQVVIMCINAESGHSFDHAHESDLRNSFFKEHHDQMKSEEMRRIELHLIDKLDNEYSICLYLRKGKQRATKSNYEQVIEDLVGWCKLLSKYINPQETEQLASQSSELPVEQIDQDNVVGDTMIEALDKLIHNREKGWINDEEFKLAKEKLLQEFD